MPTIHMIIQGVPGYNPNPKKRELATAFAADKYGGDYSKCAPVVYTYPTNIQTTYL